MNTDTKTLDGGTINYFKSSEIIPISQYLPGEKAAEIWLALHGKIEDSIGCDPLSQSERRLYESLIKKFSENLEMGEFFTATVTEQKEDR